VPRWQFSGRAKRTGAFRREIVYSYFLFAVRVLRPYTEIRTTEYGPKSFKNWSSTPSSE